MKNRGIITGFEIFLLVSASFAFSFLLSQSFLGGESVVRETHSTSDQVLEFISGFLFGKDHFVSALETSDLKEGIATCLVSKEGSACQEYPASECESKCLAACIPSGKQTISACSIGTCIDPIEGTCQAGSPKGMCEKEGGSWSSDPYGNSVECKKGCCILGNQVTFTTNQACARSSALLGLEKNFKNTILTERACLGLADEQEEGACVFDQEFRRSCVFTTRAGCKQKTGVSDSFYAGYLCSNSASGMFNAFDTIKTAFSRLFCPNEPNAICVSFNNLMPFI